jgi:hypothetical protein
MIVRLLLAIIIIVALYLFLNWFRNQAPHQISQALKKTALFAIIGLMLFLAATGRLHWLFALLVSLLPFVKRLLPLLRYVPLLGLGYRRYQARRATKQGSTPGQNSQVQSRFIRMSLDHDSGRIDGVIIAGPFNDQRLSQLQLEQLLECWQQWQQQDQESARLLEAFLDQSFGPQWREQVNEALAILGLKHPVSREDILQAHRHLIARLHPDRGGSTYLASKINQARDLLLRPVPDTE